MSYPRNWSSDEIHYHETSELLCTICDKYVHEDNTTTDENDQVVCLECKTDHECYWCGAIVGQLVPLDGDQVCTDCKSILIS